MAMRKPRPGDDQPQGRFFYLPLIFGHTIAVQNATISNMAVTMATGDSAALHGDYSSLHNAQVTQGGVSDAGSDTQGNAGGGSGDADDDDSSGNGLGGMGMLLLLMLLSGGLGAGGGFLAGRASQAQPHPQQPQVVYVQDSPYGYSRNPYHPPGGSYYYG
jgi:hypothetical protein